LIRWHCHPPGRTAQQSSPAPHLEIGEALARGLARRGYGVTLVARSEDRLVRLASELRDVGVNTVVMPADLADRGARAALPDRLNALGLIPDILVNNAGFSTRGPIHVDR